MSGDEAESNRESGGVQMASVPTTQGGGGDPVIPEDRKHRGKWGNHLEYILTSLGLAVGLGNVWRFPYICYFNGGGTFLVPYCIMLLMVGMPIFFMELSIGQYAGLSSTKVFERMSPAFKGLGYGMTLVPVMIHCYYVVIMSYSFMFMFQGFASKLPWSDCSNDFNTHHCYSPADNDLCVQQSGSGYLFYNKTCMTFASFCTQNGYTSENGTHCISADAASVPFAGVTTRTPSAEDFWNARILGLEVVGDEMVNTWDDWGGIRWELVGCLALSWIIICLCTIKGPQFYGKVAYFVTLFPYVVLTILLGYMATLEGFRKGMEYYFMPDVEKLKKLEVWKTAAAQIFFSLSVSYGGQLALASYNGFKTNCHRNTVMVCIANSVTSIYAGLVVFGVVGFLSEVTGRDVSKVITAGPGLAFVVYPEAVAVMQVPQLFSFAFFLMLILLAISSVVGAMVTISSMVLDNFPALEKKGYMVRGAICLMMFTFGLPMCFDSGFLLFSLLDVHANNSILFLAAVEIVCVSGVYGGTKVMNHVVQEMEMKIPKPLRIYWLFCWYFATPVLIYGSLILAWYAHVPDKLYNYVFPGEIQFLGWAIELAPIMTTILIGVIEFVRRLLRGDGYQFFELSSVVRPGGHGCRPLIKKGPMLQAKASWGPRHDRDIIDDVKSSSNDKNRIDAFDDITDRYNDFMHKHDGKGKEGLEEDTKEAETNADDSKGSGGAESSHRPGIENEAFTPL